MVDPNPKQSEAERSDQVAGMANLMAHPLAGMAAASAIGFGMASHALGMWMGAMAGAAEASQRLARDKPQPAPVARKPAARKPAGLRLVSSEQAAAPADKPVRKAAPQRVDDLKSISGIGPKLEQVLNARGISSYAQVAALSETEISTLDDELGFGGRIQRDDWVGQAKSLASAQKSGSKGAGRKRS